MKDERGCGYKVAKQAYQIFGKLCEFNCKPCGNNCISILYSLVYGMGTASLNFVDSYKDIILATILEHYAEDILVRINDSKLKRSGIDVCKGQKVSE